MQLNSNSTHSIYSKDANVWLETGSEKLSTMTNAMHRSGFLEHVASVWQQSDLPKESFQIAIKPNIMTASIAEKNSPVYTNPDLVELLIKHLRDRGFVEIAVVESHNVYDYSYQGRSVQAVAEMVGYSGHGYRIEDLSTQQVPYHYGGVLGDHVVGKTWRDANYRISFAKNKTHWQCFYTACLKNVYGCLPKWDKMWHYHGKHREFYECCILIADAFPVHFGFLDAWTSGDGFSGHVRDARPNQTRTILASENVYALDWVAGEKMGLDPMINDVIQQAKKRWGSIQINRIGDTAEWRPWNNVHPYSVKLLDKMEEVYGVSRFFSRAFASQQDKRFPPVSRWQWLFGIFQFLMKHVDRFLLSPR